MWILGGLIFVLLLPLSFWLGLLLLKSTAKHRYQWRQAANKLFLVILSTFTLLYIGMGLFEGRWEGLPWALGWWLAYYFFKIYQKRNSVI